jgi:hypothetical protein
MSYIYLFQSDLDYAASQKVITQDQANALWPLLQARDDNRWRVGWAHVAYVIGGFLIIGSLTWFTSLVWEQNSLALFYLSLFYSLGFGYAGNYIWNNNFYNIPQVVGGIFVTVAVAVTPVSVYALERYYDFWTPVTPGILPATALAVSSLIALCFVPFSFLTAPFCGALYYIWMRDLPPLIWGGYTSVEQQSWTSAAYGLLMLSVFRGVETFKPNSNYVFWGYLYGVSALWGGLTTLDTYPVYHSWEFKLFYFVVNLLLVATGNFSQRIVFWIFGGIGDAYAVVDFFLTYATPLENAWLSTIFGLILMSIGYTIQSKNTVSNLPFWFYLVGVPMYSFGEAAVYFIFEHQFVYGILYMVANLGLLLGMVYTKNRLFLLFGGCGILAYVSDLASTYSNAWWLPLVITLLGLGFIALAIYYSGKDGGFKSPGQALRSLKKLGRKRSSSAAYSKVATTTPDEENVENVEMGAVPVVAMPPMAALPQSETGEPVFVNYVPVVYDVNASGYVHLPMGYSPLSSNA